MFQQRASELHRVRTNTLIDLMSETRRLTSTDLLDIREAVRHTSGQGRHTHTHTGLIWTLF